MSTRILKYYWSNFWSRVLASTRVLAAGLLVTVCLQYDVDGARRTVYCSIFTMRLLEPFVRYKATKIFNNQEWSSPGNVTDGRFGMGHPSNTKWHWPRPINTPNCNSIRPVVFAQGSGDLASQHICELSSNHEHSLWLWQTNRHDDEKHAAQLKLRSIKMNRPINSGKRVDGVDQFSTQSSRSTESTKVESINYQSTICSTGSISRSTKS